jgi:hypothetical protein
LHFVPLRFRFRAGSCATACGNRSSNRGLYFQVALSLNCCKAKAQAPGVCWDRVKRGFASLERLYGGTNYERNALAFMAVRQGDQEFAQQLFARIGDNWNQRVWGSKDKFESSKASLSLGR